jgi:hypothetical protein
MMALQQLTTSSQAVAQAIILGSFTKKVSFSFLLSPTLVPLPLFSFSSPSPLSSPLLPPSPPLSQNTFYYFLVSYFFFKGGWWCWDNTSCFSRAKGSPDLVSSTGYGPTMQAGGIFSSNPALNPSFYNANLIYIKYLHPFPSLPFLSYLFIYFSYPSSHPGIAPQTCGRAPTWAREISTTYLIGTLKEKRLFNQLFRI